MARERALTPLAIAALALLTERDMHPYEMFTTMTERREDLVVKLRAGSLYHAVNRLAEDGSVVEAGTDRDGNRPERTRYAITEAGRERLQDTVAGLIAEPGEEYPSFPLAVSEAHNLDRDRVRELFTARLARLDADVAAIRAGHARALEHAAEVHLLDLDYLIAMRTAEADWLRRTVERLDDETLEWKATCHDE
ncbi:PadR family transcriptional regulator [Tsukamurella ocularis]|uniref:PadR family transcriptional regulator n=1 Tax=Tsukamurella ocularis TaxID=1970234 RepID=UPI0021694F2F|nr:PadR family transcriptional regulator [Tsukamurella ocularis]MCS3778390.1 DNA-binding PadR family transcriptional regulator [Tsukamurella ocularis]MCS3789091.1 DNA-binding PadR family transcriptional regulator [Tsukamurella ocularis]MCS3852942.1 DNA-binding PadR family transcriptional regulator [Tsukamurella ocularis]